MKEKLTPDDFETELSDRVLEFTSERQHIDQRTFAEWWKLFKKTVDGHVAASVDDEDEEEEDEEPDDE